MTKEFLIVSIFSSVATSPCMGPCWAHSPQRKLADCRSVACSAIEAIDPKESSTCVLGTRSYENTDLLTAAETPMHSVIFIYNSANGNIDVYLPKKCTETMDKIIMNIYKLLGKKLQ